MSKVDALYLRLLSGIVEQGYWYEDKSREVRCKQLTSLTIDFDIEHEFPLLTTKKLHTKSIVGELIWFLRGDNNIKYLVDNSINIWNKDAYNWHLKKYPETLINQENFPKQVSNLQDYFDEDYHDLGDVGRNYSIQWRDWTNIQSTKIGYIPSNIDQIKNLIEGLIENPMSRRHIVTAWNPTELDQTALPPCHWSFEVLPRPAFDFEKELNPGLEYVFSLKWHQRSCDTFLGIPYNIASYAILSKIIQELTGYKALGLIGDLSNIHLYEPHIEKAQVQMKLNPNKYGSPTFKFSEKLLRDFELFRRGNIELSAVFHSMQIGDFIFENYESYPTIKAKMYEPTNNNTDIISDN